jgi:putative FmdB family regulatory protein
MPIYEYICNKCKTTFSLIQKIGTSEKDTTCPQCGSTEVKKKLSLFSSPASKSSTGSPPPVPSPGGGT